MKKEDILSLLVYLVLIAAAIITGCTVVGDVFVKCNVSAFMNPYVFSILTLLIALLMNVVGLELLHALGAKIGGYKIVSINFLGFNFEKRNGKITCKYMDYNGLTGETKICPAKEKTNLKPFVWMPLLGYAIEMILGFLVITLKQNNNATNSWIGGGALLFVIVSSMIALYNLVPLKLDTLNDGYRLVLSTVPVNKEAFDELMRVEDLQRNNQPIDNIKTFDVVTDFTASVNLLSVYENLSKKEYEAAKNTIGKMVSEPSKMSTETYNRLMAQKIYIVLMMEGEQEAKKVYNEEFKDDLRRFIANDNTMESLRAYVVIAGLIEDSESEVEFINKKVPKILKKTLPSRAALETKLYQEAVDLIYSKHTDWN